MTESFDNMTEEEIIDYLLGKYKDDADAVETIQRAITDIEYLRTKKKDRHRTSIL